MSLFSTHVMKIRKQKKQVSKKRTRIESGLMDTSKEKALPREKEDLARSNIDRTNKLSFKDVESASPPLQLRAQIQQSTSKCSATSDEFKSLGVCPFLVDSLLAVGIIVPTPVQKNCIPRVLAGNDVIGLASTGSGKTAAFAVPVLQELLREPYGVMTLVLAPTRELAAQIGEQFRVLAGHNFSTFRCSVCIGGDDLTRQAKDIKNHRPHVVVGTPGRVRALIELDGGKIRDCFKRLRCLVLDEADRLLEEEFEDDIQTIVMALPQSNRQTLLFSATKTQRIDQIRKYLGENAFVYDDGNPGSEYSDYDAVMKELVTKTVQGLIQKYLFIPDRVKDVYLVSLIDELSVSSSLSKSPARSIIIFCSSCRRAQLVAYLLSSLSNNTDTIMSMHSRLSQKERRKALHGFKSSKSRILVATDVASRGLDIPTVDAIVNYDVPHHYYDYIHRVGRTARAGRGGIAITLVTQFEVRKFKEIEVGIGLQLEELETEEKEVLKGMTRVFKARRAASLLLDEKPLRKRFGD